ncbi:MAG: ATP-binding protein, partial [Spirochaetota bacterium]
EIKNPLTAMSLHVQLMQRILRNSENNDFSYEQLLEYCNIIQEEIGHLNTFVTDFLLTVRPLELELVSENIHNIILPCLELLQPELESKGITLDLHLAEELPDIALDAAMFKRMLLNLLQNAIQAIEEKEEKIETLESHRLYSGKLSLRSYHKNNLIYLEILDNGCGMSEEIKKKIFEPFFTTRVKGSGLGMTMVLRILQTHNGDLQIQSEEGTATMFRIALPVFQQEKHLLLENPLI